MHESDLHPGRRKVAHDAGKPASPVQGELAAQAKALSRNGRWKDRFQMTDSRFKPSVSGA